MATLYSDQYQDAFVDVPSSKINAGDVNGPVRSLYAEYTLTASIPAASDIIKMGKLPKGARLLEAIVSFPDLGGSSTIDIGWAASSDGAEVADPDGIMNDVDLDTAADTFKMTDNLADAAGFGKKFAAEVDVQMLVNNDWTATSGAIQLLLLYTY